MTTPVAFDIKSEKQPDGTTRQWAEADDEDLKKLEERATTAVKTALGVTALDMSTLADSLRTRVRDPHVDTAEFIEWKKKDTPIGQATVPVSNHRYTIVVPDQEKEAILNLGHGDPLRDLVDSGISARAHAHIHLHTRETASLVALGGPTKVLLHDLADPKKVLENNGGIGAVTNGHIWAEAKGQLNLAAREGQAVLRSHTANVRVQADATDTEVAAGHDVVVAAKKNVKIVAESSVDPNDNAYGKPFGGELTEAAAKIGSKDLTSVGDIASAALSLGQGMVAVDEDYKAKKNQTAQFKNDVAKLLVDAVKLGSTLGRFIASKASPNGQVKIAADTFASMSGGAAASMYGRLSASVTSLVSASMIGGTASVKGLSWASVWAMLGVSVRTRRGKASLSSDKGTVSIKGGEGVGVSTPKTVSIGGDVSAELKSKGCAWVSGLEKAKVVAGKGEGAGLLVNATSAYLGGAESTDQLSASAKHDAFVAVNLKGTPKVTLETSGCHLHLSDGNLVGRYKTLEFQGDELRLKSKRVFIG